MSWNFKQVLSPGIRSIPFSPSSPSSSPERITVSLTRGILRLLHSVQGTGCAWVGRHRDTSHGTSISSLIVTHLFLFLFFSLISYSLSHQFKGKDEGRRVGPNSKKGFILHSGRKFKSPWQGKERQEKRETPGYKIRSKVGHKIIAKLCGKKSSIHPLVSSIRVLMVSSHTFVFRRLLQGMKRRMKKRRWKSQAKVRNNDE